MNEPPQISTISNNVSSGREVLILNTDCTEAENFTDAVQNLNVSYRLRNLKTYSAISIYNKAATALSEADNSLQILSEVPAIDAKEIKIKVSRSST